MTPIINNSLILAPMSQITNLPHRLLCKKYGASLAYSEMTFCDAIIRQNPKSMSRGFTSNEEQHFGIQLLGSNPDTLLKSAFILNEIYHPEVFDINLGCPSSDVTKNGYGAALLKEPETIRNIITHLSSNIDVPVTAKMRILNNFDKTLKIANIIESSGAYALTIHGRTKEQGYSGSSNFEFIKNIKRKLSIPVIANGDIVDEKIAKHVFEYTECDGIMIGRAAMGNPYIFKRISHYLDKGEILPNKNSIYDFFEYISLCNKYDMLNLRDLKFKAHLFVKNIKNIKPIRAKINSSKDIDSIIEIVKNLKNEEV